MNQYPKTAVVQAQYSGQQRGNPFLEAKLEELKSKGMWRKDQIAREMGITTTQLTSLMKKYDIAAFWQKPTHEMRT